MFELLQGVTISLLQCYNFTMLQGLTMFQRVTLLQLDKEVQCYNCYKV